METRFALVFLILIITIQGAYALAPGISLGDLQIAEERIPTWNPGVEGGIPDTSTWAQINAQDYGATPNDGSDDSSEINAAITAANNSGNPTVVFLPEGEYNFDLRNPIYLKSNAVLKGEGPEKTIIKPTYSGSPKNAIQAIGSIESSNIAVSSGYTEGSKTLTLAQSPNFGANDFILITQNNGTRIDARTIGWVSNNTQIGQVLKVSSVNGSSVSIDRELRTWFDLSANPRVYKINPIYNFGIEDLTIEYPTVAGAPGYVSKPIQFTYAANGWVKNVHAKNAFDHHLAMSTSARITVRDSYFKTAQKATYTNSYAISFSLRTSDCLVTNNIMDDIWVSAIFSGGVNGNVYSYNYHTNMRQDHDTIFHGTYPFANLVEGNEVSNMSYDCWWGRQGEHNTFFRNRSSDEIATHTNTEDDWSGSTFNCPTVGDSVNYMLNSADWFLARPYCKPPEDCFKFDKYQTNMWTEHNVYRTGFHGLTDLEPSTTYIENLQSSSPPSAWVSKTFPASLYLTSAPDFWGSKPWPATGADVDDFAGLVKLPAQDRYEGNDCSNLENAECSTNPDCIWCSGECFSGDCCTDTECNAEEHCTNHNCQATPICNQGEITLLCICNGGEYENGYCCSGSYQTTPCSECVDMSKLMSYISQWKIGTLTMPVLMQKITAWKTQAGC